MATAAEGTNARRGARGVAVLLASLVCLGAAVGAEWRFADAASLEGIDGLVGDDPILMLSVESEGRDYLDVQLERIDPLTGLLQKEEFDEVGCGQPWRHAVRGGFMARGDSIMWFLTSRMPPGAYALVDRPSGSNEPWQMRGEPFWVVTQPVARVVPCHDSSSRISIARQPVVMAARERVERATVRIRAAGSVGQGVVINPWGHVLTAASVVGDASSVQVGFAPRALGGMGDRVLTYRPVDSAHEGAVKTLPSWAAEDDKVVVLVPVENEGLPEFLPVFAPLVDRARLVEDSPLTFHHATWLYANHRGTGESVRLKPQTPEGAVVPTATTAGPLLEVAGPVAPGDVGGPVYDHVGRVWGVLVSPDTAQWSTVVVEQYLDWVRAGIAPSIRGPLPKETP